MSFNINFVGDCNTVYERVANLPDLDGASPAQIAQHRAARSAILGQVQAYRDNAASKVELSVNAYGHASDDGIGDVHVYVNTPPPNIAEVAPQSAPEAEPSLNDVLPAPSNNEPLTITESEVGSVPAEVLAEIAA